LPNPEAVRTARLPAAGGSVNAHRAYLGVGSNLGDKLENCRRGVAELLARTGSELLAQSRTYRTEPVDYLQQDWFVNYVVLLQTPLEPPELLRGIQAVQRAAGRPAHDIRFGPRVLDLDILLFDDLVLESEPLVIPHPRLHKRRFVLQPLCDINPDIVHPILLKRVQELLDALDEDGQRVIATP
jgi:2-amino-4-hydroxy-6-hydroxymethyldihydropteridine diphosphokinase